MTLKPKLDALTGLRFVAAGMIFLNHSYTLVDLPAWVMKPILAQGVALFFVLSGFVLAYNYGPDTNWKDYAIARFARIYPTYLLALAAAVLVSNRSAPLCEVILLQTWQPCAVVNGPGWTIAVEAFFYLLFPLVVLFRAEFLALMIALAVLISALFLDLTAIPLSHYAPARFAEFATGVVLCRVFNYVPARGGRAAWTAIEITALLVWYFCSWGSRVLIDGGLLSHKTHEYLLNAGFLPASAFMIFVFALQRGALSRLLSSRISVLLGEASYAFYLLQLPIIQFIGEFYGALALSSAAAIGVHLYFESPLRKAIRYRVRKATSPG